MDYEGFYSTYLMDLKGITKQKRATCPFCGHKDDCSVNVETGQCKCFYAGCLFEGDAFDFLIQLKNLSFSEAARELEKWGIKPLKERGNSEVKTRKNSKSAEPVDYEQMRKDVRKFAENLTDDLKAFLRKARGLSNTVIVQHKIGFARDHPSPKYHAKNRLTIPVPKDGEYINIRFHSLQDEKPKDLPYQRELPYATWLFPEDQLENNELWLCEGELDALCAISHGLPAITITGGAGAWKDEFTALFKGKKVNIVYDCDEAGKKGAKRIAEILCKVAEVKIIDLGLAEGEDLTDWFVTHEKSKEELERLAAKTPIFEKLTKAEQEVRNNVLKLTSQSLSVKELLDAKLPDEEFLIGRGLVPKNSYVLLAGATKEGKTILALQIGLHLISGTPFLEQFPVKKRRRVLYLYAENTLTGLSNILTKQITGLRQKNYKVDSDDLGNFILQEAKGLFLDKLRGSKYLNELAKIHSPSVVFIDPLSLFTTRDINRLENATKMVTYLNRISTERDCSWVIIHHYRKPSKEDTEEPIYKVMGSSGFGNYCETFMGLERSHKQRSSNFKTLHFLLRREETPEPVYLYRDPETLLYEPTNRKEVVSEGVKVEDVVRILREELKGKASYTLITSLAKDELGVTKTRIQELLHKARNEGLVGKEKGKFGEWFVL